MWLKLHLYISNDIVCLWDVECVADVVVANVSNVLIGLLKHLNVISIQNHVKPNVDKLLTFKRGLKQHVFNIEYVQV